MLVNMILECKSFKERFAVTSIPPVPDIDGVELLALQIQMMLFTFFISTNLT